MAALKLLDGGRGKSCALTVGVLPPDLLGVAKEPGPVMVERNMLVAVVVVVQ